MSSGVLTQLSARNIDLPQNIKIHESVEQLDADTIRVGNQLLTKPFVEKPFDGENHNIWIYYSDKQGGGVRKLFRKIANKSSEYVPGVWEIRRDDTYIYEEFMDVDNAEDVKIYSVGEHYFYAETRKYYHSYCITNLDRLLLTELCRGTQTEKRCVTSQC